MYVFSLYNSLTEKFVIAYCVTYITVLLCTIFSATICSRCNNRCEKRERTDQAFRELVLREKCLLRKLALKEREVKDYAVSTYLKSFTIV